MASRKRPASSDRTDAAAIATKRPKPLSEDDVGVRVLAPSTVSSAAGTGQLSADELVAYSPLDERGHLQAGRVNAKTCLQPGLSAGALAYVDEQLAAGRDESANASAYDTSAFDLLTARFVSTRTHVDASAAIARGQAKKRQLAAEAQRQALATAVALPLGDGSDRYSVQSRRARKRAARASRIKPSSLVSGAAAASACFADYVPLHGLWSAYIASAVCYDESDAATVATRMLKADLTGAELAVVRSRAPSQVGLRGLCIMETAQMFVLCTRSDRLVSVAKAGSLFMVQVGACAVTLYGSHLCFRGSERMARRFKVKPSIDL